MANTAADLKTLTTALKNADENAINSGRKEAKEFLISRADLFNLDLVARPGKSFRSYWGVRNAFYDALSASVSESIKLGAIEPIKNLGNFTADDIVPVENQVKANTIFTNPETIQKIINFLRKKGEATIYNIAAAVFETNSKKFARSVVRGYIENMLARQLCFSKDNDGYYSIYR